MYKEAMKTKLEQYISFKQITVSQAAREIGVSRPLLYYAMRTQPLGRRTALMIEEWSDGFVPAVELVGLSGPYNAKS